MLRIGTSRKKITPSARTFLAGYAKDVISDGIHDDLYISAISFDDGKSKAVLLSFDLIGMDKDLIRKIH